MHACVGDEGALLHGPPYRARAAAAALTPCSTGLEATVAARQYGLGGTRPGRFDPFYMPWRVWRVVWHRLLISS